MKIIETKKTFNDFLKDYSNKTITITYKEEYNFIHNKIFNFFYSKDHYKKRTYSIKWDSNFKTIMGKWMDLNCSIDYDKIIEKYNFYENT